MVFTVWVIMVSTTLILSQEAWPSPQTDLAKTETQTRSHTMGRAPSCPPGRTSPGQDVVALVAPGVAGAHCRRSRTLVEVGWDAVPRTALRLGPLNQVSARVLWFPPRFPARSFLPFAFDWNQRHLPRLLCSRDQGVCFVVVA